MLPVTLVIRLAQCLHDVWAKQNNQTSDPEMCWDIFDARLRGLARHRRLYRLAIEKKFKLALPIITREMMARLSEIRQHVDPLAMTYAPTNHHFPDLSEWVLEIRQLEAEFGEVEVRWNDAVIRVVTDSIVLQGVELGSFAIEFVWSQLGSCSGSHCFEIVALEPNPACGQRGVVHPHVRDGDLCAGDATRPISQALKDGRLGDAFLLVRSVLTNYNPQSPYVSLDEWEGVTCSDCGGHIDLDDRFSCDGCEVNLCDGCSRCCEACVANRCTNCISSCDICDTACCQGCLQASESERHVCPSCFAKCSHCEQSVPTDELDDLTCNCEECTENIEANDDSEAPLIEENLTHEAPR